MDISGNELLHFYQQASFLLGNQTNQGQHVFVLLIYLSLWLRLWVHFYCDQKQQHSVPLNILSSVVSAFFATGSIWLQCY